MKVGLLLALALASIALLVACDNGGDGATPAPDGAPTPAIGADSEDGTPTPAQTPSPGETPAPPNVCQPNPDPATPELQVIDRPSAGDTVTSPVTISGQVAAFEATFKITIYQADGSIIADVTGMSQEGQTLSPFSEDVAFSVSVPKPACIWVYEASARDGSLIHVGQIPVTLSP